MNHFCNSTLLICTLLFILACQIGPASAIQDTDQAVQTNPEPDETRAKENKIDAETRKLHDRFQENLTNTKFIGQFTITGMENEKPKQEEYTISKVKKLPKDDLWEITARIKYGDHDLTVPMVMAVRFAGKTPVITVDKMFVPGLGTFDARVLLRKDKYAGTWMHDNVGGHLFGRIEKIKQEKPQTEK